MANNSVTTFKNLQIDERLRKLERSLKLVALRQESGKSTHDGKTPSVTTWPSISSINADTLDSSCATPAHQSSFVKSEVLGYSSNLRNVLLKKNSRNQEAMTTSSVKQWHGQQNNCVDRGLMPPPANGVVCRISRESPGSACALPTYEMASTAPNRFVEPSKANALSSKSAPSWISTNTNADGEYFNVSASIPTNCQVIGRVFSNWRVTLNNQHELVIRGTLECGKYAHSKPVVRRHSATCVESKYMNRYILRGNIVDERNRLPDYVRGKFFNGFPDDWENVYQIWRAYVDQGYPVTFHWPTRITDSDDDLKSELTDLTCTLARKNPTISATRDSCNGNTKTGNLNSTHERKENYQNASTRSLPHRERDTRSAKPVIPNSEKDAIPVVQTKSTRSPRDEANKANVRTDTNLPSNTWNVTKLKDFLREDKLKIIIDNLEDRNCSARYIDKILELLYCLDYAVSYRTRSECGDSVVSGSLISEGPSKAISLQPNLVCNGDLADSNRFENDLTKVKSYGHSTDLGYGSIRSDSRVIQVSNPVSSKPSGHGEDLDKSESETYAGVPKISIERVLKARETSGKVYKRNVRKKTIYPDAPKHASSPPRDEPVHVAGSVANNKNLLSDESGVSITEDEVEATSGVWECRQATDVTQRTQMTFSSHRERNNFDVYGGGKSKARVQNVEPFDASEAQRANMNVFIRKQEVPCRDVEASGGRQRFIADVDYTVNSDIDVVAVSTKSQKTGGSSITSGAEADEEIKIVETNGDSVEKRLASPKSRKEFIEQMKSELARKRLKPTIVSSVPVNLNVKIHDAPSKARQPDDTKINVRNGDKQDANIRPLEETDKKKSTSIATKPTTDDFHSKATTVGTVATKPAIDDSRSKTTAVETVNKKEIVPTASNKKKSDDTSPTNSMTDSTKEQSKSSKLGTEKNPKVLTAWVPKVVYYAKSKSELGLTFQGKLLNEAGHVVHRNFTTSIVAKRLSATLIKTVNNEFYQLVGYVNDSKHTIPKELVKQCRNGCPTKIEQFCLTWKNVHDNVEIVKETSQDTTIESLNGPVSSRGRRILPPLCFWEGERVTVKDNNLIYTPGNSQESLLLLTNNSKEVQKDTKNTEERKKQKVNTPKKQNVNEQTMTLESNKTSGAHKSQVPASKKSPKTANVRRSLNNRRIVQKLFSSVESSDEEEKVSPRKRVHNSRTNENIDPEARSTMTLRKRPKVEPASNRISRNTRSTRDSSPGICV
ncbi:PREDICTED: uncharacterized protein LOC105559637 isoform X2 [Vollenhovia emeryi]|uniref:uncharacterized protein LOC105559637 isoform X2 n=1 Tax=Vollenhovia emeryi TaxID=411798 RepID=UPI0005F411B6|nr:PREDICTED: uncharacterized protein LOC105559637 isoform X2 [Vollenhovia emeryi]